MADDVPLPVVLLGIINVLKVDIPVVFSFAAFLKPALVLFCAVYESYKMVDEPGFYPETFQTVLLLFGSHVSPFDIDLILNFQARTKY